MSAAARHVCTHCGGTGYRPEVQAADLVERLRDSCRDGGTWVSPDGLVREADAASLLGLQPKTLANWRATNGRLPYIKRAGRPLYSLTDLAAHMAESEK